MGSEGYFFVIQLILEGRIIVYEAKIGLRRGFEVLISTAKRRS
jgi:hypothetical protein